MAVTGSEVQEKWLEEMGEIAHGLSPAIDVTSFKGVLRFAIAEALKDHGLQTWGSVAGKEDGIRKRFLESVLKHAEVRIHALGATDDTIGAISRSLRGKIEENIARHAGA